MKKLLVLFLVLTVFSFAAAAENAPLECTHELNMEDYGTTDCTVPVSFTSADVDENNVLSYSIYGVDIYDAAKVLALQPGNVICVNGEEMTVAAVEPTDGGADINGGFFSESEDQGATLCYVDGDPDHMYSAQYDDAKAMTMLGQAAYPFADEVTVRSYRMNADMDFEGEYDEVTLPAAEVKAYLAKLEADNMIEFTMSNTKLTMENGKITAICADWTPNG